MSKIDIPTYKRNLAAYKRQVATFEETFGVSAENVIQAMDEAGDDIPYQKPDYQIELPNVGMTRKNVPVQLIDPFGSGKIVQLNCDVKATTHVPAAKRGIHTSRIGNLIAKKTSRTYKNLQEYALDLVESLTNVEYGISSTVMVSGVLSYLEEVVGWKAEKDKSSLEHLGLRARAYQNQEGWRQDAGLSLNHITACPCVQQTYKHGLIQAEGNIDEALKMIAPLLTHSQRCQTLIEIKNIKTTLPLKEILETLDQIIYRTQNTLPREYELQLVYNAHKSPQFIEDAARQMAAGLYFLLKDQFMDSSIYLHSVSMESIHDFDIVSEFEISMEELQRILSNFTP